jgi:hypothetical protein
MNDESMRQMMMAATKMAIVERAMGMAMRVAGNKEGKGDNKKDGIGDEGGVRRRATIAMRQWQMRHGCNDSGHCNKMMAGVTWTQR